MGITSARRLEQRIGEDLAFRYLAAGAQPDFWTLNAFRRRHPKAMTICSRKCWSWRGPRGWDGWATWPSTRRAWPQRARQRRGAARAALQRSSTNRTFGTTRARGRGSIEILGQESLGGRDRKAGRFEHLERRDGDECW
ncbi:MAG: transposase [Acidobacteria bacterium]|nr:transposase [Acidobacteriota bacterium]